MLSDNLHLALDNFKPRLLGIDIFDAQCSSDFPFHREHSDAIYATSMAINLITSFVQRSLVTLEHGSQCGKYNREAAVRSQFKASR